VCRVFVHCILVPDVVGAAVSVAFLYHHVVALGACVSTFYKKNKNIRARRVRHMAFP
jgi:hypothetical protein